MPSATRWHQCQLGVLDLRSPTACQRIHRDYHRGRLHHCVSCIEVSYTCNTTHLDAVPARRRQFAKRRCLVLARVTRLRAFVERDRAEVALNHNPSRCITTICLQPLVEIEFGSAWSLRKVCHTTSCISFHEHIHLPWHTFETSQRARQRTCPNENNCLVSKLRQTSFSILATLVRS